MIARALGLPLRDGSRYQNRGTGVRLGDLPATPDPRRGLSLSLILLCAVSVVVVLATAGTHLGRGITYADIAALCATYVVGTVASVLFPWHRVGERWLLLLIALPIIFVASLSAVTGAGNSPYSALYAPILAVAGWFLPVRHAAAAIGLVVATEVWRALAMDGSRSVEQLAVVLPFDVAVTAVAFLAGSWLRAALTSTRGDQVRMARTLEEIRTLGADPERSVLADLEGSMARIFDAEVRVLSFAGRRPGEDDLTARLLDSNVATVLVPGSSKLHGLVRLTGRGSFSAHDLRLAAILAEAAGRTLDAREAINQTRAETERDALTGLLNRRAFDRDLAVAFESASVDNESLALLFIDVDRFKLLNDEYGHAAGDAVLVRLAGMLRVGARRLDGVYRFGGDEFAILLRTGGREEADAVAQRIMRSIANPSRRSTDLPVPAFGVSIGIAVAQPMLTPGDLLAAADASMYEAKRAGGGIKNADPAHVSEVAQG